MAKEQECAEIEKHGDSNHNFEFSNEYTFVKLLMTIKEWFVLPYYMYKNSEVRQIVEHTR